MIRPPYDDPVDFTRRWWPVLAALALGVTTTIWTLRAALAVSGGALVYGADDVYIEMALARTLASHGVWGVTPDAFAGVGTSLLWPLLLAAAFRLTVAEWWPLVFAAAASLGVVLASAMSLRRYVPPSVQAWLLLGVTGGVSLSALTMLGMEHPLQVAVTIVMASLAARMLAAGAPVAGGRMALQLACLAAVAVAVRYDTGALAVAVVLAAAVRRQWRVAACVAAGALVPALIFAGVATAHGWPLVPVTLEKARLVQMDLQSLTGWWQFAVRGPLGTLWRAPYLLALVIAAIALALRPLSAEHSDRDRECRVLLWLFLMVATAQLLFGLPAAQGDYRYDAWVVGLGVVATGAAAGLGGWPRRRSGQIGAAVVTLALVLHGVTLAGQSVENVRNHFSSGHQVGLLLRDAGLQPYPAVHELGAAAWLTGRPILDIEGLSTPDVRVARRNGDWTPARFSALAASLGTRVVVAYGVDDEADEVVPAGWLRVSEWRRDGGPLYVFLAADADTASALRHALKAFDARLPAGVTRVDGGW